jgi:predicted nucleic acid-binding protein
MIIVSDTTPFRYLIEIEEVHIIEALFGNVIIPEKVAEELQHANTPQKIKDWMLARPAWLEIKTADLTFFTPQMKLDQGEHEAIALAVELQADRLLIDDRNGRIEAKRAGVSIVPTMAMLELAAQRDLIDLPTVIDELRKTSFHLPPEKDIQAMLERDRLRKQGGSTPTT